MSKYLVLVIIGLFTIGFLHAENGSSLWLRGVKTGNVNIVCKKNSATIEIAKTELQKGWQGSDGATVTFIVAPNKLIKNDGFILNNNTIQANTDQGILYGVFKILSLQQTLSPVGNQIYNPSYQLRLLNHWDNPDGSVERGYAGQSIFWRKGTDSLVTTDNDKNIWAAYARANASIGINGSVINNVNSDQNMLTPQVLKRVKDIADALRPYGIKTYMSVKFSSPALIGGLKTSDPFDKNVINWWNTKVAEIYTLIPDFGGFLIKANSEGQPGPQDYGRTHADGANMLAKAVKPFGGIVMWRAFVYQTSGEDRAKQAYNEFIGLDGSFSDNVIIQIKNGPVDFMPREPFSPLFGAMKKTSVMPELQITQEYLGHSIHLVFLATMWEEFLQTDTYQNGNGSTVAKCTDGSVYEQKLTAIAGVANIGLDTNWCGHVMAQANWYAFGRLAWNNSITSQQLADEWLKLTFGNSTKNTSLSYVNSLSWTVQFLNPVKNILLTSRETAVNYMMPLGLHHIMSANGHYGPGPWWAPPRMRKDWTPPYYHNANNTGLGFNRTATGSNAVSQYHSPLDSIYNNIKTCPDELLLWFHHVPWNYTMKNGRTMWNELCYRYDYGVQQVRNYQLVWDRVESFVDKERFLHVQNKLRRQTNNAILWKDACTLYFQTFSNMPIPYNLERQQNNLDDIIKNDMYRPTRGN